MAGSKKLLHWQTIVINKFDEIKDHPDFNDDYSMLFDSKNYANLLTINLHNFYRKYDTPRGVISFLKRLIEFDENNSENITPPIMIVSEVDKTVLPSDNPYNMMEAYTMALKSRKGRVLLDITPDTQREDIDDFLDLYFETQIKPKLRLLDPARTNAFRSRQQLKDYYKVITIYKKLKAKGLRRGVNDKIQLETGITSLRIKKFIEQYRKQKKFDLLTPSDYLKITGQQRASK